MQELYLSETKEKMEKARLAFANQLSMVRSGQANASLLDSVRVDYYGEPTPLNQICAISVVEGKQLLVKPFDPSSLKSIEKAIFEANLNLTPMNDGVVIRINVPQLTEEVRKNLVKQVNKQAEEAKVQIRNIRRDQNDAVKKGKELTEDIEKDTLEKIQKITDDFIKKIDEMAQTKGKEILKV